MLSTGVSIILSFLPALSEVSEKSKGTRILGRANIPGLDSGDSVCVIMT
jgi:hypothetical protein